MDLSIIIVSYNTCEITRNCLQSIRDSNLQLSYEVIVVDNASTDGSVEMIEQEFPEIILIKNSTNNMFAKANNQGMKIARGDYFLLLNSDTIVTPGNIEKMFYFISAHSNKIGCVGPKVLNSDGTVQSEGKPLYSVENAFCDMFSPILIKLPFFLKKHLIPPGNKLSDKSPLRRPTGWVSGACMMVSAKAARAVEGFDEEYFFYGEEVDFCQCLKKAGYAIWVLTDAEIIHLNGGSTASDSKKKQDNILNSRAMFCQKHFSRPALFLYFFIYLTGYKLGSYFGQDKDWKENCKWWVKFYDQIHRRIELLKKDNHPNLM